MPNAHQIIIGASSRDAITNMATKLRDSLASKYLANVYSYFPPEDSIDQEVSSIECLPKGNMNDVLIYHSSFGIPEVTNFLLDRPEKLVLMYHNISPSIYYEDSDTQFVRGLEWGRQELVLLRDRVVRCFADSHFNARDLELIGYRDIQVIPAGLDPYRLDAAATDTYFLGQLAQRFPNGFILFVSQVLPHKRAELAIEIVHLLRTVWRLNIGLVIAGPIRNLNYYRSLECLLQRLPESQVWFTEEINDSQLATLYRSALIYLGTSDHEGLGIPPLEAMAARTPVVVREAGAVTETVGDGGLIVPKSMSVGEIASTVARVIQDKKLRFNLIASGTKRIESFVGIDTSAMFCAKIEDLFS